MRPATSPRSSSACPYGSAWMIPTRSSAACDRVYPPPSPWIRGPCRKGSDGDGVLHEDPARNLPFHGDVHRDVHRASGHPDRRVVPAGHRRWSLRLARRDRLGTDLVPDRRDRDDSALRLADTSLLHAVALHRLRGGFHGYEHALRHRVEHRKHDRLRGADARAGDRRMDHRHPELALALLYQSLPGTRRYDPDPDPGEDRRTESEPSQGRRLSGHRAHGDRPRDARIRARGGLEVELVR